MKKDMSPLKLTIILIVAIFGVVLIVPLFLSDHIVIKAAEEIHAPAKIVFSEINNLHKQKLWYPFKNDSITPDSITEPAEGFGAQRMWMKGDTILRKMVINKSEPFRYVEAELLFENKPGATERWYLSGDSTTTKVRWEFQVLNLHYPFGRWLGLIIKNSMQPALETGLKRLKKVSESEAH